jgi:hypothetical protein
MADNMNTSTPNRGQQNIAPMMPVTTQVKAMAEKFFNASGYNPSIINPIGVTPNGTTSFNLLNTGLVDKVVLSFSGSIPFKNADSSDQLINLAPEFPYNAIQNISVMYNGSVNILNASPYELLALSAKRGKNVFQEALIGGKPSQYGTTVSNKKASVTVDSATNGVLNIGNGLTGYSSLTVKGGKTCVVNWTFNITLPFTLRSDLPLGLLALQNNSIICQVNITAPALIGTTAQNPFYVPSSIPATLTLDATKPTSIMATPVQYYWETPADKNLYGYFVSNSYMNISIPSQSFRGTGSQAFQYQLQNNYILTSMLFTLRDSANNLLDAPATLNNFFLNYNNTTSVDKQPQAIREFLQESHYEGTPVGLGQLLWDATIHEHESNGMISTSFLDMYKATSPQFFMDVNTSVLAPCTFSAMREIIVPAQIRQA